jgi:ribonuclease R
LSRRRDHHADPHAAAEAARYERPIASREHILERLRAERRPLAFAEVAGLLGLTTPVDVEALRRRLRAMCRDGQLLLDRAGRYALVEKLDLVRGRVVMHRDGDGHLEREAGGDGDGAPIALPAEQLRGLVDGDRVLVRTAPGYRADELRGIVVEVLARHPAPVVGLLWEDGGVYRVRAERHLLNEEIMVPPAAIGGARTGDYVLVRLTHALLPGVSPVGAVERVLGPPEQAGVEREVILAAHRVPTEFSAEALAEAAGLPAAPLEADCLARLDLRDLDLVTIDGEDARDFDDAVYCEALPRGGFRLLVAIADVGHYVLPGSALDADAQERGNSVYFPDLVLPMLPEALSNGLCSLRPHEVRLCLACDMTVSRAGVVTGYVFHEGVMRSAARLTYTQVATVLGLAGGDAAQRAAAGERLGAGIVARLEALRAVYEALRAQRERRGALDFEPAETRIVFGENGRIAEIRPRERNDAHRLIEECMIAANVCAAQVFDGTPVTGVYRAHERPDSDRLDQLREFLGQFGLALAGGYVPRPGDFRAVLEAARGRPFSRVLETTVLRSLKQAVYAAENRGHFGLALAAYTHFTSPIRRYADLLVHRALRYLLRNRRHAHLARGRGARRVTRAGAYPYNEETLAQLTAHVSATERRADAAVRDLEQWLKCDYMQDRIGEVFDGTVASVVPFGVFVEIDGLFVEGLVHVSQLGADYYHHDRARQELRGERTGDRFHVGRRVRVQLARVDLHQRRIDFVPADRPARGAPARRRGR